jgi:CrcB protein
MTLLVIGLGGALGAVARYVVGGWVQDATGGFFPWGTLVINVSGSLLLGFVLVWLQASVASADLRQFIAVGFLGSFTTFSTFSYEGLALIRDGEWWQAGGYIAGSVVIGLVAAAAGAAVALALTQPGRA